MKLARNHIIIYFLKFEIKQDIISGKHFFPSLISVFPNLCQIQPAQIRLILPEHWSDYKSDCRSIYPKLLYLWYGSSSQSSFALKLESTARLYEKHEFVFKEANLQWIPSGTCMDLTLVVFKLEKSAGLRLIKTMVAFWFLNGWSSWWASERVRDKVNKWVSCFLWFQLQYGCNDSRK